MGKIITNRELIEAPAIAPLRYGLFTAARGATLTTRMIGSGLQFLSDHCGGAELYDQTCEVSPTKEFTEGSDLMGADPYWIVARKRCGTVGRTGTEMLSAVRQQLISAEQTLVESVVWDGAGVAGATPTLTGAGATVVTPGAPGAGAAIAALEEAFYDVSGYQGVIHINMRGYAAIRYAGLMDPAERVAGVYKTPMGTSLSIGSGYGITGPAGVAPAAGFVWAFMTSPITVWRSGILPQPDPRQTLDRTLNQWDVVAEEVFAHTWDCPDVFAVQVPIAAPATAATPAVP
jgi:hypothetical protein